MAYSTNSRPVDDYNEIAHHFAEAIYAYCHNTKLRVFHNFSALSLDEIQ